MYTCVFVFFFFKQKTAYEMRISDWSSDVCSSDLLAGLAPDVKIAREITDVFQPVYEKFYAKNGIKVLGFSTYPAQVLFCNADINDLSDVKGKKVRTSSRTTAEFVQALGGSSVTLPDRKSVVKGKRG